MTFVILTVLALFIILIFRKYRRIYSVIIAIFFIIGMTTAFLLWGMSILETERIIHFFNGTISGGGFYFIIAAWYAADAVCSALIIRSHIAYRKINPQGKKKLPDRG